MWVLKSVAHHGGNFSSRHSNAMAENKRGRTDPHMIFHRALSELLDWLCCVGQIDATNLMEIEALLREYQLIEEMKVAPQETTA